MVEEQPKPAQKSNTTLIIVIVLIVLIALGGGGWYLSRYLAKRTAQKVGETITQELGGSQYGTSTSGEKLELPSGVPAALQYPDSTIKQVVDFRPKTKSASVALETSEKSLTTIADYYKKTATDNGWTLGISTVNAASNSALISFDASTFSAQVTVYLNSKTQKNEIGILVDFKD